MNLTNEQFRHSSQSYFQYILSLIIFDSSKQDPPDDGKDDPDPDEGEEEPDGLVAAAKHLGVRLDLLEEDAADDQPSEEQLRNAREGYITIKIWTLFTRY